MTNQLNKSLEITNKWLSDPDEDQEFKDLVKTKFLIWYIESNKTIDFKPYPKLLEIIQEFENEKSEI